MNRFRQVGDLARREFIQRARSKAFVITMLVIVGAVALIGPVVAFTQSPDEPVRIGVVGTAPAGLLTIVERQATAADMRVEIKDVDGLAAAEGALREHEVDVVIVDAAELVWLEDVGTRTAALLRRSVETAVRLEALRGLGLSDAEVDATFAPVVIASRTLIPPDPEETPRRVAALLGMFVLYISILVFGQFVAMGTVEEKQNRVVEVVLSRVKPEQILVGKVLGIGLLGLVQLFVIAIAAVVAISIIDVEGVSLPGLGVEVIPSVILWFLLGYAFYSFVYATLGATVSRQEDLQGVLMLPLVFILPGFFMAQIAAEGGEPPLIQVASLLPPWSPMVMPVRTATGSAGMWEVALAIALIAAAVYALVRIGGRVYTGALLRTSGKVKLTEAWRAARS